jgi:hypothetical protein
MDVVLVKDFGTLLSLAGQATLLGQQHAAAGEMLGRHFAREWPRCGGGDRGPQSRPSPRPAKTMSVTCPAIASLIHEPALPPESL